MIVDRVEFTIKFSVNLDPVEGWGHNVEDYFNLIGRNLIRPVEHYQAEALIPSYTVRQWDNVKKVYI